MSGDAARASRSAREVRVRPVLGLPEIGTATRSAR